MKLLAAILCALGLGVLLQRRRTDRLRRRRADRLPDPDTAYVFFEDDMAAWAQDSNGNIRVSGKPIAWPITISQCSADRGAFVMERTR